jgi:protein-arginine kinase activator protein McsA
MIILTEKKKIGIELFCLVIIISLCIAVYVNGKDLNCDKCYLTFKQTKAYGKEINPIITFNVKMLDIFNNFTKDNEYCLVEWVKTTGFIDKSNKLSGYNVSNVS